MELSVPETSAQHRTTALLRLPERSLKVSGSNTWCRLGTVGEGEQFQLPPVRIPEWAHLGGVTGSTAWTAQSSVIDGQWTAVDDGSRVLVTTWSFLLFARPADEDSANIRT